MCGGGGVQGGVGWLCFFRVICLLNESEAAAYCSDCSRHAIKLLSP